MSQLAAFGGPAAVPPALRAADWPVITAADRQAVTDVLDSGKLVSDAAGEPVVERLERAWAERVGTGHCVAVASGTAALEVALASLGIGRGDEVIMPALSFIATGIAPLRQLATPVFADIDPVSFTIDASQVAARVTARTAAVIPVHLHGQPAAMEPIGAIAGRHGLALIEDAAQAHGASYHGRPVGSLGQAGAFSLQVAKNLPTCGEGGLITTDDRELARRMRMTRQFGEIIETGQPRDYISYLPGWNAKISPVQAAFALSQLDRFAEYDKMRRENVTRFLSAIADLPGLRVPRAEPGTRHVWHILRFVLDAAAAGLDGVNGSGFRQALHRLLRAEGVPVSRYQVMPLPRQRIFGQAAAGQDQWPVASAVIENSLTLQKRHLNPYSGPLLGAYTDAFRKVWDHLDVVSQMARAAV